MRRLSCVPIVLLFLLCSPPPNWAEESDESTSSKVKVPAEVDEVIRAGRGDLLLLQMNSLAKLVVFDIKSEKITGYIPLGGSETLVAGTADSVVLLASDKNVLQRWTLKPLEKALTVASPLPGEIDGLAAGYAGSAPVLMMTREGPRFLNPSTLKLMEIKPDNGGTWSPHPQYPIHVAASADGSTFAGWVPGVSPGGIRTLRLEGNKLIGKYEHSSAGELIPSADGSLLFTGVGVYSSDLRPLDAKNKQSMITFPTIHPAYYVGLTHGQRVPVKRRTGGRLAGDGEPSVSLYSTSERTVLLTLEDVPGLGKPDPFAPHSSLSWYERIVAHPAAKKLIIVDESRTLLHLLPLDVVKSLDEKGIDYLFVESLPITSASAGQRYEYAIKVLSKAGKVKFTLDSGPEKMTISSQGVLRWDVPQDFDEAKTSVIVSIEDGSKQSIFQSFAIYLNDGAMTPDP
jgi:hypothetical protein